MKTDQTPQDILTTQFTYISDAYAKSPVKKSGSIQLSLRHSDTIIDCFFFAGGGKIAMEFGKHPNPTCALSASLYDWLDMSANRLNPIWGAVTGRLKFKGKTSIFGDLMPKALVFDMDSVYSDDPVTVVEKGGKVPIIPKDIVVLNGSPRGRNGYTFYYLGKLLDGISKTTAAVEIIDLCKRAISPCNGCYSCWKNPESGCVQHDDVSRIYSRMDAADIVIYAFPLYYDGVPGILKNLIDRGLYRMHPYMIEGNGLTRHPRRSIRNQRMMVFAICGFPEYEHFQAVQSYFRQVSHNSHIPIGSQVYRTACMHLFGNPVEYRKLNDICEALHAAGEELGRTGLIGDRLIRRIESKVDRRQFQKSSSKFWENVIRKRPSELVKV